MFSYGYGNDNDCQYNYLSMIKIKTLLTTTTIDNLKYRGKKITIRATRKASNP